LHVFWQCRVHQGDDYPWWYPSQTTGGSIREDRLVLPMDPKQHWTQTRPMLLPGMRDAKQIGADRKANKPKRVKKPKHPPVPQIDPSNIASGGFRFAPTPHPHPYAAESEAGVDACRGYTGEAGEEAGPEERSGLRSQGAVVA
jgi:hypothetical protein